VSYGADSSGGMEISDGAGADSGDIGTEQKGFVCSYRLSILQPQDFGKEVMALPVVELGVV